MFEGKSSSVDRRIIAHSEYFSKTYVPENLPHREKEVQSVYDHLSPVLAGQSAPNLLIAGSTGLGKTAVVLNAVRQIERTAGPGNVLSFYLNCNTLEGSEYEITRKFANTLLKHAKTTTKKELNLGWPMGVLFDSMRETLETLGNPRVILVLDEMQDPYEKKGADRFLYNLPESVSLVGISNELGLENRLDVGVKSRLNLRSLVLEPYIVHDLIDILQHRAKLALEPGTVDEGVVPWLAGRSVNRYGSDARRALDLLFAAAQEAEITGAERVLESHAMHAEKKLNLDAITQGILALEYHPTLLLCAIATQETTITKGYADTIYKKMCISADEHPNTERSTSTYVNELDKLGLISAPLKNGGHAEGRTRRINLNVDIKTLVDTLREKAKDKRRFPGLEFVLKNTPAFRRADLQG